MDYSGLEDAEDLEWFNKTNYDAAEVMAAKVQHIKGTLDHYDVYDAVEMEDTSGISFVDTRWAVTRDGDGLKARLTGRGYKWKEPGREDVVAPMSQPHHSRVIDFLALKGTSTNHLQQETNPMVTFETVSALTIKYHTTQICTSFHQPSGWKRA